MAFGRRLLWIILFIQAISVAWIVLGLAIFLPSGGIARATAIILGAIIYLGLVITAMVRLKQASRKTDAFAAIMSLPPLAYFGVIFLLAPRFYARPRPVPNATLMR